MIEEGIFSHDFVLHFPFLKDVDTTDAGQSAILHDYDGKTDYNKKLIKITPVKGNQQIAASSCVTDGMIFSGSLVYLLHRAHEIISSNHHPVYINQQLTSENDTKRVEESSRLGLQCDLSCIGSTTPSRSHHYIDDIQSMEKTYRINHSPIYEDINDANCRDIEQSITGLESDVVLTPNDECSEGEDDHEFAMIDNLKSYRKLRASSAANIDDFRMGMDSPSRNLSDRLQSVDRNYQHSSPEDPHDDRNAYKKSNLLQKYGSKPILIDRSDDYEEEDLMSCFYQAACDRSVDYHKDREKEEYQGSKLFNE